jgi:ribosome-binding ATPase YchF (GTP1/OBG family)
VHLGAIKVPDGRVEELAALYHPKKVTHAEMRFVDLPGPKGKALDGESLRALADVDALCLVLRGFPAADGSPSEPLRELRDFEAELVLADLGLVERRLDRLRKEHAGKAGGEFNELARLQGHLEAGKPLRTLKWTEAEQREMAHFTFVSRRPMLVVVNVAEEDAAHPVPPELEEELRAGGAEGIALCAALEAEIADLDPADQPSFLASVGLAEPARERFIRAAYHLLDLISFFTSARTRCAPGRCTAGTRLRARRGGSTRTSSGGSSGPRSRTSTTSSPPRARRRRANARRCGSRARSTWCGTGTSSTSAPPCDGRAPRPR